MDREILDALIATADEYGIQYRHLMKTGSMLQDFAEETRDWSRGALDFEFCQMREHLEFDYYAGYHYPGDRYPSNHYIDDRCASANLAFLERVKDSTLRDATTR